MNGLDVMGHLAYVMLATGTAAIARGQVWGWLARVAGSLCWLMIGYEMGYSSIVVWSAVFAVVDAYGAWKSRDREVSASRPLVG